MNWLKRGKKKVSEAAARMNSLTAKPCFIYQPPSSSVTVVSCRPKLFSSVRCPIKTKKNNNGRLALRIQAYDSSKNESNNNGSNDSKPPNGALVFLYFTLLLHLLWWFSFTILLSLRRGYLSITKTGFVFNTLPSVLANVRELFVIHQTVVKYFLYFSICFSYLLLCWIQIVCVCDALLC